MFITIGEIKFEFGTKIELKFKLKPNKNCLPQKSIQDGIYSWIAVAQAPDKDEDCDF